jgi:hypothetical protein
VCDEVVFDYNFEAALCVRVPNHSHSCPESLIIWDFPEGKVFLQFPQFPPLLTIFLTDCMTLFQRRDKNCCPLSCWIFSHFLSFECLSHPLCLLFHILSDVSPLPPFGVSVCLCVCDFSVKEFAIFLSRTLVQRTRPGLRQRVHEKGIFLHFPHICPISPRFPYYCPLCLFTLMKNFCELLCMVVHGCAVFPKSSCAVAM